MARKLASIQKILNIETIENSDRLELIHVLGWQCVVNKKDNFKVGDLIVYLEIDSICPDRPEFEFLRDRKFRIKSIKLRGALSQGLVLPLSILPKGKYEEGDDVTRVMNITQYIPEGEREGRGLIIVQPKSKILKYAMRYKWFKLLWNKINKPINKKFPDWIKKTDEDRIQSNTKYLLDKTQPYFATIKMDGCSVTLAVKNKEYFICSRNVRMNEKKDSDSDFIRIANQIDYKSVLDKIKNHFKATSVVIQGEMIGRKINGNHYKLDNLDYLIFNLIADDKKFNTLEIEQIINDLDLNLKTVPIVKNNDGNMWFNLPDRVEDMLALAQGDSLIYPYTREGIVVRSKDMNISFKVINNDYLLEEK